MYVLIADVSEFMECQIYEYLIASKNRKALEHLARQCQLVSPEGNFNVYALNDSSQLKYVSFQLSDWNYTSYRDHGIGEPLEQVKLEYQALLKEHPEASIDWCTIKVANDLPYSLRHEILKKYHSDPKRFLEGKRWQARAIANGSLYSEPKKYEFYQDVYLGLPQDINH